MRLTPCALLFFNVPRSKLGAVLACLFLTFAISLHAAADPDEVAQAACPMVKIEAERLPDLNVPRSDHALFYVNGEVVVAGGHTDGFVPTETAEYFADGEWHLVDMVYTADCALCQVLSSGKVLIAGGLKDNLGIGQLWSIQTYDPAAHSFTGFGCLDKKRAWCSGVEMDSGRVVISGNWYHDDAIGLFDGTYAVDSVKPVAQERAHPFLFRTAPDNAIVFSWYDTRGRSFDTVWVDRLRGEPFRVPLLETWRQLETTAGDHRMSDAFIGDEAKGDYSYLLPVQNEAEEVAIVKLQGEEFSLLPTAIPVPVDGLGGHIYYFEDVVVDRIRQCGYLTGFDDDHRLYVLRIDYLSSPALLSLYYTDPLPAPVYCVPVLTDDGDLVLAGGKLIAGERGHSCSNFKSNNAAYILRIGSPKAKSAIGLWWWLVTVAILLLAAAIYFLRLRRNKKGLALCEQSADIPDALDIPSSPNALDTLDASDTLDAFDTLDAPDNILGSPDASDALASIDTESSSAVTAQPTPSLTGGTAGQGGSLFSRICSLMEEQQLFLRSDLKVQDVATALEVTRAAISNSIHDERDCSFNFFVNTYRIDHAKRLMLERPEAKVSSLYLATGFANETSFFRAFKDITGKTPTEWRSEQQIQ